ncbi:hypothetical protein BSKO_09747 [Bryopsis sp. KO-2023]|nr:hypothetical protein BSKO_09747 [Bryopsis sp. KO-2023]
MDFTTAARGSSFGLRGIRCPLKTNWNSFVGVGRGRDSIRRPSILRLATSDRIAFNESQQNIFNGKVKEFLQPLPLEIVQRLESIVGSVPELGPDSRVMDVGSGTGCLIPCLQSKGVSDILAVDISPEMCAQLEKKFPNPGVVGNELGVRVWCGDIVDIPDFMGPVDCIFMNAVFGNFFDVEEALLRCALMLRPGGKIVISHPLGRNWQSALHAKYPKMVPHALPDREGMETMIRGLPLEVHEWKDESDLYVAVLEVPPFYTFKHSPLFLEGKVVVGMGRGSKQMGVPTANVDPVPLKEQLESISQGVYFGWAQLQCNSNFSPEDGGVFPMVMNVGNRPTIEDEGEITVEAHILHDYGKDFHGENLKLCALGFLRPEVKFPGLDALIARIKADIGMSKSQLQAEEMGAFKANPFFS